MDLTFTMPFRFRAVFQVLGHVLFIATIKIVARSNEYQVRIIIAICSYMVISAMLHKIVVSVHQIMVPLHVYFWPLELRFHILLKVLLQSAFHGLKILLRHNIVLPILLSACQSQVFCHDTVNVYSVHTSLL